jgi:hypothetical protein
MDKDLRDDEHSKVAKKRKAAHLGQDTTGTEEGTSVDIIYPLPVPARGRSDPDHALELANDYAAIETVNSVPDFLAAAVEPMMAKVQNL